MRTARLRAPAFLALLSLSACANIWGFDDLRSEGDDSGAGVDVTTPPQHDATATMDAKPDQSTADHTVPPDVVVHDARPDVDSSMPDAHDADVTVPDARDADADVSHSETGVDTGPDSPGPDGMDVTPGPDAGDAGDATVPDAAGDVAVEAAVDSGVDSTVAGSDVTAAGTIVTSVAAPITGNADAGVIRDNVFPPLDSTDPTTEFDTNDGTMKTDDFVGYTFATAQTFTSVVFQDGIQSSAGGFFDTIAIQVEDGTGVWTTVPATASPAYLQPDGHNFEIFTFTLTPPVAGMGIRVDGVPGGTGMYVSVGELRVFAR